MSGISIHSKTNGTVIMQIPFSDDNNDLEATKTTLKEMGLLVDGNIIIELEAEIAIQVGEVLYALSAQAIKTKKAIEAFEKNFTERPEN